MTTLRRAMRKYFEKIGWARTGNPTGRQLADDFGLPREIVTRVLDEAAAELRNLSAVDESADARPIIHKAVSELAKFGFHSQPVNEAAMERCLEQLDEGDLSILRHFKEGMAHGEIAALLGTDVETVRHSLVKTYTELRMRMMGPDDDGDPLPLPHAIPPPSLQAAPRPRRNSHAL